MASGLRTPPRPWDGPRAWPSTGPLHRRRFRSSRTPGLCSCLRTALDEEPEIRARPDAEPLPEQQPVRVDLQPGRRLPPRDGVGAQELKHLAGRHSRQGFFHMDEPGTPGAAPVEPPDRRSGYRPRRCGPGQGFALSRRRDERPASSPAAGPASSSRSHIPLMGEQARQSGQVMKMTNGVATSPSLTSASCPTPFAVQASGFHPP